MDSHRLLVFRQIARTGLIAGAARELGWTQPAVSQHLRLLERQTGLALVLRRPRGVLLTEAGRALLRHADGVAAGLRAAADEMDALARLRAGAVRIAVFPSAGAALLPAAMGLLLGRHPGLDVRLREAEPPQALDLVAAGEADVAVTFVHAGQLPDEQPGLVRAPLGDDPVRLVLPRAHPHAAGAGPVDLRLLAAERWIAGCDRCAENLRRACAEAGFTPDVRHGTDDYVISQRLIAAGLAVGLLPQLALDAVRDPGVAVRDVLGLGPRTLHLVHHREAGRVPAVRAAVHALQSAAGGGSTAV
ncbi:LysR family transcriptional regulator [Nonomuraea sp. NN258]|uniref:LysR family transcriptional regulator n=1 Tax=Nonomuraea antri TaxID=2730852 RepID=UPI001568BF44|nr:LysR family transcriptional regulator [Nonomuraea antri]NRQ32205.1 LysR family transcriptional regulator [Nonomuraea antri]